jgi:putative phosphoesterase
MNAVHVGLISDTHGLLRPEAVQALQGVDRIIHAGDIGNPMILEQLAAIAPVIAVRGNNDRAAWSDAIPTEETVHVGGAVLYVLHDLKELDRDLTAAGVQAVISGHSHRPSISTQNGMLFVNPGSAGPRRFKLPISVGFLEITQGEVKARLQILDGSA